MAIGLVKEPHDFLDKMHLSQTTSNPGWRKSVEKPTNRSIIIGDMIQDYT